jgi:hypothetical protein
VLFEIKLKLSKLQDSPSMADGFEQLLALMLPLELSNPGLFGDNL